MSRKWLEREAPGWVDKEIISAVQAERLLSLYDEKKHAAGILPILGSLLVGLGILTFVAANWQEIHDLWRLVILIIVMSVFYAGGERFYRRGDKKLGLALAGIGLMSFGAAMFLIVQMFHLLNMQTTAFILWGIAGVLLTFLYRSTFIFILTAGILNVAQIYSLFSAGTFSVAALSILIIGLGAFWIVNRHAWLAWLLGVSLLLQSIMLVAEQNWNIVWFLIPALVIYAAGDWVHERNTSYPLQSSALTAVYLFGSFMVMFASEINPIGFSREELPQSAAFLIITAVLLVISLLGKWRNRRLNTSTEWVLLLPWFFIEGGAGLLYLLALCTFSLFVLWNGYAEQWRFKINLGTVLFLFAILLAYTRLAWAFMDKSLFFLVGGVILLLLSWYLNRRRRRFLKENGGETHA
ncbi:DUF2157 domain-containing protein [Paenibacillus abyssi]|uniref:DUF2157 domain-containing protein n=1 Tax=Paenibacillus abyssi TaxID=1340531 RepID=A0A917D1A0_9BACL|nr:DUF2157 domain-containing protein [Paenibacillus abyssi]GGG02881.1 hypothetical protein GCM10010916_19960 [Paenibacillus abyssi]